MTRPKGTLLAIAPNKRRKFIPRCRPLAVSLSKNCQNFVGSHCPLRVNRVGFAMSGVCPVYPGGLNRSTQHFILEGKMECGMERRFHRGFTAAEKTELWDRWKRGESLKAIGRAFGKPSSSIYFLVAPHGGIRPAERRRSRLALTLAEREVISRGVTAHRSARSIAKLLGRSPSTVSREMSRNGGYDESVARPRRQK